MGSPAPSDRVDRSCCLSRSLSTTLCNSKSDNWCKVIQLLLEDIRSRGSQQNATGEGAAAAVGQGRTEEAQAEALGSAPKLLLHGREMPRLLQNHNGFLSRPDCCRLLGVLNRSLPVHWWKGQAH